MSQGPPVLVLMLGNLRHQRVVSAAFLIVEFGIIYVIDRKNQIRASQLSLALEEEVDLVSALFAAKKPRV